MSRSQKLAFFLDRRLDSTTRIGAQSLGADLWFFCDNMADHELKRQPSLKEKVTEGVKLLKKNHYDNAQRFIMYKNGLLFVAAVFAMHKYGDQLEV